MGVCQALRQALRSGEPVVAPLCYDPLTSKLVERTGFPAAYLGGGAFGFVLNVTEAILELKKKGHMACDPPEIKMIRVEINALVELPKYWELEARTVEK